MNEQIMKILPAKKDDSKVQGYTYNEGKIIGHNNCLDDCAAAIEKANLVVCPSEQKIIDAIFTEDEKHGGAGTSNTKQIAKALLALLRGEK